MNFLITIIAKTKHEADALYKPQNVLEKIHMSIFRVEY